MSTIATARLQNHLDSLAAQYELLVIALGTGAESGSLSEAAASVLTDVLDTEDNDVVADLRSAAYVLQEKAKVRSSSAVAGNTASAILKGYVAAIKAHVGSDLSTVLATRTIRVHPYFNQLYYDAYNTYLDRDVVFPLATTIGTLTRAAGAATYATGDVVEDTWGGARLVVAVAAGVTIGAADWILTLTCKDSAGTSTERTVTVAAGATAGTEYNVGSASDLFVDVTAVSATGGTDGDEVDIEVPLLRSIVAVVSAP